MEAGMKKQTCVCTEVGRRKDGRRGDGGGWKDEGG